MGAVVTGQVCRRCGGPVRKRYDGEGGWYYACRPCAKAGWPDATTTEPMGAASQLASALAKLRKRDTQMTCPRCSKQFVGYSKGQRYCSARCQSQATSAAHRAARRT